MFQNIKVDIIYYKTSTDFEMEFNLSGCCRMRLLTDKSPDRKILVNQLVRAVSRSRIIIITGALFGDDGIIATCAKAISRPLAVIDNSQFSIASDDKIEIIKDSVPLVSTDGIFGGCIIEQGPQTLILLSENKNMRKNIMQNLIHQYVKEVCAAELIEKKEDTPKAAPTVEEPIVTPPVEPETVEAEATIPSAEDTLIFFENDEENVPDDNDDDNKEGLTEDEYLATKLILADEDNESKLADDGDTYSENLMLANAIIGEVEDDEDSDYDAVQAEKNLNEAIEEGNALLFDLDEDDDEEYYPRPLKLNIPIFILAAIVIIAAIILCYSVFLSPDSQDMSVVQQITDAFNTLFG